MANAYKVLAQSAPLAAIATDVYTVPVATETVISTIIIANRAANSGTFRLSIRPAGAQQSNLHFIAFDVPISGNDSTTLTLGVTMRATDVLTAFFSSADMSINIFGTEITP